MKLIKTLLADKTDIKLEQQAQGEDTKALKVEITTLRKDQA